MGDIDSTQLLLLGIAALVVLLKAWQGWRLGLIRQLISLAALGIGSVCGFLGSHAAAVMLRPFIGYPDAVLAVCGGLAIGCVVFLVITLIGAILFKKTGEQDVTLVRVFYGLSGAILGALHGLLLVCVLFLALRLLGGIAETRVEVEKHRRAAAEPGAATASLNPVVPQLAEFKKSLDAGATGTVLQQIDPVPKAIHSTLSAVTLLVSDPTAMHRLIEYPGVRPVIEQPKVNALLSDPALYRAITEKQYLSLLTNPRLIAAANDPQVTARLGAVDLQKALDYALRKPENAAARAER